MGRAALTGEEDLFLNSLPDLRLSRLVSPLAFRKGPAAENVRKTPRNFAWKTPSPKRYNEWERRGGVIMELESLHTLAPTEEGSPLWVTY